MLLKVCGMRAAANVAAVASLRPDYMGFIFYEASPRYVSLISSEIIQYVPPEIKTVGVFVNENLEEVLFKQAAHQLKAIQLHGQESVDYLKDLKERCPQVELIKAFGISEDFDFQHLEAYTPYIDYFLFDTYTKMHGGSGKSFNWQSLAQYPFSTPYFLSGGIGMEHLKEIENMNDPRLKGIDINSRFETEPGLKDVEQVEAFIKLLKNI